MTAGHLDSDTSVAIAGGEQAHGGDVVATRRNDRRLITTAGESVRNRETWTVVAVHPDGALTVTQIEGHGTVRLPVDYVREHVRLGYAATEHGYQSATVTAGIELASAATTRRGLYVGVTRGRDENLICVITDSDDVSEARDVLDAVLAVDRVDIPAVTQRRTLATQQPPAPTRQAPQPGRCRIPDWFHDVMAAIASPAYVVLPMLERWLPRRNVRKMIDDFAEDFCEILKEKEITNRCIYIHW